MDNVVCDLVLLKFDDEKNDWFEYDRIGIVNYISYDDLYKCLFVYSHGLETRIKHIEDFRFEFRFRFIDHSDVSIEKSAKID